jgi:hypothetical protein
MSFTLKLLFLPHLTFDRLGIIMNEREPYITQLLSLLVIHDQTDREKLLSDAIFTHTINFDELADLEVEAEDIIEYATSRIAKHISHPHTADDFRLYVENIRYCTYPRQHCVDLQFRIESIYADKFRQAIIDTELFEIDLRWKRRKGEARKLYGHNPERLAEVLIEIDNEHKAGIAKFSQLELDQLKDIPFQVIEDTFWRGIDEVFYGHKRDPNDDLANPTIINTRVDNYMKLKSLPKEERKARKKARFARSRKKREIAAPFDEIETKLIKDL